MNNILTVDQAFQGVNFLAVATALNQLNKAGVFDLEYALFAPYITTAEAWKNFSTFTSQPLPKTLSIVTQ